MKSKQHWQKEAQDNIDYDVRGATRAAHAANIHAAFNPPHQHPNGVITTHLYHKYTLTWPDLTKDKPSPELYLPTNDKDNGVYRTNNWLSERSEQSLRFDDIGNLFFRRMSVCQFRPQYSSDFDETWHTYSLIFISDFVERFFW